MAHKDAKPTFDRHMKFWSAHPAPIRVVCPKLRTIYTPHKTFEFGFKSHHGEIAIVRFRSMLHAMLMENQNDGRFMFYEYDSVCLDPLFDPFQYEVAGEPFICGNVFSNDQPGWVGSCFIHPPIAINSAAIKLIEKCCAEKKVANSSEGGYWDRWLGLVCDKTGMMPRGWGKRGFSMNTIEIANIGTAMDAVSGGAVMIHGIKGVAILNALLSARKDARCC